MDQLVKVTKKQKTAFIKAYLRQLQWRRSITPKMLEKEFDSEFGQDHAFSLSRTSKLVFYHPIRFLNWINGLSRVVSDAGMIPMITKTPFPLKGIELVKNSEDGNVLTLGPCTGATLPGNKIIKYGVPLPVDVLVGAIIIFKSGKNAAKKAGYPVLLVEETFDETSLGRKVTLALPLDHPAHTGDNVIVRQFAADYEWHWDSRFAWDTDLT
jgi:hypothetical protein